MNEEVDDADKTEAPKIELLDETRPARKVNHMALLTRNGAAVRGTDNMLRYLWRQTRQDVTITVVAPAGLKASEVRDISVESISFELLCCMIPVQSNWCTALIELVSCCNVEALRSALIYWSRAR
jgi:hypothetical protein